MRVRLRRISSRINNSSTRVDSDQKGRPFQVDKTVSSLNPQTAVSSLNVDMTEEDGDDRDLAGDQPKSKVMCNRQKRGEPFLGHALSSVFGFLKIDVSFCNGPSESVRILTLLIDPLTLRLRRWKRNFDDRSIARRSSTGWR
eukprot:TRINITY_DN188_c0_g1_i1.p1 TRINITY_DN188_c0_g1~~TRINITY_DN188_c0_g1_i1.p1  ORF type:complete len:142 (-),score=25.02 TRINITY_DN188_c0_g1_i1:345-770(-)